MTQMVTQPTLSALTSSKDSVKKAKNVFTPTISHSTEPKKSIFMSIKEFNLSWMPLEASNSVLCPKTISINSSAQRNSKWWKVPDPKSSVSSFWRLLKKISTDGNGIVQTDKFVNTNIAFLQDTFWKRMKLEKQKLRPMKSPLRKRSMLKEMSWWARTRAVIFWFN